MPLTLLTVLFNISFVNNLHKRKATFIMIKSNISGQSRFKRRTTVSIPNISVSTAISEARAARKRERQQSVTPAVNGLLSLLNPAFAPCPSCMWPFVKAKKKAGRPKARLDVTTGKLVGLGKRPCDVIYLFWQTKNVEAVRSNLHPTSRRESTKKKERAQIRRILRKYKHLLKPPE